MNAREPVCVVMSTFNGEPFVAQQLTSILAQLGDEDTVLIRDDGSRDATVERVAALQDRRIVLIRGENLGVVGSFHALLSQVPASAGFVFLSDQDDAWLPGRLERALRALQDSGGEPTLYASRAILADAELNPVTLSPGWPRGPSFAGAVVANVATGCTMAMNQEALDLVRDFGDLSKVAVHDWWIYLVTCAFGKVVLDDEPTILYRQHGANVIGMSTGLKHWLLLARQYGRRSAAQSFLRQLENFVAVHGQRLSGAQRDLIARTFDLSTLAGLARFAVAPLRLRQTWAQEIAFRGVVVLDRILGRAVPAPISFE